MNKKLSKRNKFINTIIDTDRKAYNRQCNCAVSLLRNEKKSCSNIDTKVLFDNRTFWKTIKPLLSEKVTKHS